MAEFVSPGLAARPMETSCLPFDMLAIIINLAIVNRTPSQITDDPKLAIINHTSSYMADNASHDLKTCQAVRLTCRIFHEIGSKLLIPILNLRVDQDSLQRAQNILTSPRIGFSVRNVRLDLNYRPKMLADNVGVFAEVARTQWKEAPYPWYSACKELEPRDPDEDESEEEPEEDIEKWYTPEEIAEGAHDPGRKARNWMKSIILRAHAKYAELHHAQYSLLSSGTFAKSVASLIRELPNVKSFTWYCDLKLRQELKDPVLEDESDENAVEQFLCTPLNWLDIEHLSYSLGYMDHHLKDLDFAIVKILVDLPIALHDAGVPLKVLKIDLPWPETSKYTNLGNVLASIDWSEFRDSCQTLEVLTMPRQVNWSWALIDREPTELDLFMRAYFETIVNSPSLRSIDLDCPVSLDLGKCLAQSHLGLLTHLSISDATFFQNDLERLVAQLNERSIQFLSLSSILLARPGMYFGIIESLRSKLAKRCAAGRCAVRLYALRGGEIREPYMKDFENCATEAWFDEHEAQWENAGASWYDSWEGQRDIVTQFMRIYITGEYEMENPLGGNLAYIIKRGPRRIQGYGATQLKCANEPGVEFT